MKTNAIFGRLMSVVLAVAALAVTVTVTGAAADGHKRHEHVKSKTDAAVESKLSPDLQAKVDADSTAPVAVVVSLQSSAVPAARKILAGEHFASRNGVSLAIGTVTGTRLPKLASLKGVVSVEQLQFKQTGSPTGNDPDVGNQPDKRTRNDALRAFQRNSVPYDKAPPLKTSNFDQLKSMDVLDAKTHNFTGAWQAGYTGTGVTASVLDGGTDWGHPDLVGTWQVWTQSDVDNFGADPGWVGWPKAFDPYSTLVLLAAPASYIPDNLSWYTVTQSATCTYVKKDGKPAKRIDRDTLCSVSFGTKTGPARNFGAPAGTNVHTYTFPASWSKSGTVKLTSHPDEYLLELYGERPAVLVTDPNTAGQYDTVYVDLSDDYSFADEKPVTKSSPVSYRDLNGDGYTDLSGGLLYYVSDGHTTIPGGPTDFGDADTPASGDFLAWSGDFDPGIEGHGTLTASNVVGQGVINGKAPSFDDLKSRRNRDGVIPGMVIGGAPNAKLAPMGDIYFSFGFSKQFGYLLTNEWGVQVTSNSYGSSELDNDGMDAGSREADFIYGQFGNASTPLFSTGNGAPGYGTVTAPSPVGGLQVGAATNFGSSGWDSIANYSQVSDNDVIEWSNRGPGANGRNGVDVVADGSYAPGDATLNTIIDGQNAWTTWGGTSRSTPVAVGEAALVYQAYAATHGGAFPTEPKVASYMKSSAKDLGYDNFTQGAGSIDAGRAVAAAAGTAPSVSPNEWRPHTAGTNPRFPQTIDAGQTVSQAFTTTGGSWTASDRILKQYATDTLPAFKTAPLAQESVSNFNAPDYLIDITDKIKAHPDADIVVIRATYPHEQFDGNTDYAADQSWRLLAYNWTDVNHDGRLWKDKNGNGVVNHADKNKSSNIDGFNDIDFGKSEMEQGEYGRFFYHRPGSNVLMGFIRKPAQRMGNGVFIGFQHSKANPAIDQTDFKIEIDYYKNTDWSWLTTTPTATGFSASLTVPTGTPAGMYEGSIVASSGSQSSVIPVAVTVAPTMTQGSDGSLTAPLTFGGSDVATAQSDQLYNNGAIFGANDWTWRAESGDWRFYWFNIANPVPDGTLFLANTTWDDPTVTDLDTLVFGQTVLPFDEQFLFPGAAFTSYDTVGGSQNTLLGAGAWGFNTATGTNQEVVAAPAQKGQNAIVQHGVGFNGDKYYVPFKTTVGSLSVNPTEVESDAAADGTGSFDVTVKSSVDLPGGLKVDAFGLSQPRTETVHAHQDDPSEADPSTATAKVHGIVIGDHASRATFTLPDVGTAEDIDLFVARDTGGGHFEVVGSSLGPAGANEEVSLTDPEPGTYEVWVYGFGVSASDEAAGNTVGIDIVQGNDLTVTGAPTGAVTANTPYTLHVSYVNAVASDDPWLAELLLGPDVAPTAVTVPITINGAPAGP